MKKIIGRLAVCIVVFIITLFVSSGIYNKGNEELTTSMAQASLPLVHITTRGISYNYLRGLKQEMDGSFFPIRSRRSGRGGRSALSWTNTEMRSVRFPLK